MTTDKRGQSFTLDEGGEGESLWLTLPLKAYWSLYKYVPPNIQQFYVLPIQCIFVFCVDLRTNSDYFPIQH